MKKIAAERPGRVQETQSEQNDAETEENILKEEIKQETEEFVDDSSTRPPAINVTVMELQTFSEKIAHDWKKLAVKLGNYNCNFLNCETCFIKQFLGFKNDEITFFEENNENDVERARNVLQLWFEDDEDATMENLLYILEGLELTEAADTVKNVLNSTVIVN